MTASPVGPPFLAVSGLQVAYAAAPRPVRVIEELNFTVRAHEFVCIVGPSGCGKSTLLRTIAGTMPATGGSIRGEGRPGQGCPVGALVPQEHGTFPWLTVRDNVAFGLEARGVAGTVRRAAADVYLDRVGLGQVASHYPGTLSVGMRQRVAIGRAFVAGAPLLLMDEPFGALDVQTRQLLQQELLRVWAETRPAVLFVTHDIAEAVLLADRILVMPGAPGRIVADIPVSLPRPRDARRPDAAFLQLVSQLWDELEAASPARRCA
jgi:NitT/TauT family transport system ATP-binding protein